MLSFFRLNTTTTSTATHSTTANMPPKKDVPTADTTIVGYDNKETRLLAAAFVASVGPDKVRIPPAPTQLSIGSSTDSSGISLTAHSTTIPSLPNSAASPRARSGSFGLPSRKKSSRSTPISARSSAALLLQHLLPKPALARSARLSTLRLKLRLSLSPSSVPPAPRAARRLKARRRHLPRARVVARRLRVRRLMATRRSRRRRTLLTVEMVWVSLSTEEGDELVESTDGSADEA